MRKIWFIFISVCHHHSILSRITIFLYWDLLQSGKKCANFIFLWD